jgi:hypothetical protein
VSRLRSNCCAPPLILSTILYAITLAIIPNPNSFAIESQYTWRQKLGFPSVSWEPNPLPSAVRYDRHAEYHRAALQLALKYTLSDLPAGYSLFLHHKQQKDMSDRTDVYMFVSTNGTHQLLSTTCRTDMHPSPQGSKHVLKFRSPNEFFGHACEIPEGMARS